MLFCLVYLVNDEVVIEELQSNSIRLSKMSFRCCFAITIFFNNCIRIQQESSAKVTKAKDFSLFKLEFYLNFFKIRIKILHAMQC